MPSPWVLNPARLGAIAGVFTFALRLQGSGDASDALNHMSGLREETTNQEETERVIQQMGSAERRAEGVSHAQRNNILLVLGELAREHIVPNLVYNTPVWRGNLAHSTNYVLGTERVSQDEELIRLIVYQNAHRNMYFYRQVMEEGRTPGSAMPPVRNIEEWALSKVTGRTLSDPRRLRRTAFMIARSIAIKGIEGRDYTTLSIQQSAQAIADASARLGASINIMESGPGMATAGITQPTNVIQVYERGAGGRFAPRQPLHRRS